MSRVESVLKEHRQAEETQTIYDGSREERRQVIFETIERVCEF